jgi:hypothetical protein
MLERLERLSGAKEYKPLKQFLIVAYVNHPAKAGY